MAERFVSFPVACLTFHAAITGFQTVGTLHQSLFFPPCLWVVQYSQIDSNGVSGDKKGLHWYQSNPIPMVLLVNMHLIKET